ncbi:MAG: hypothetical protein A2Y88_11565 [Chloroflexi bacterium RBG_13_48_10]|nr:MAG: hypothetical protein A2Y88_11565 [Chloroflexi bacterium RBG_13_48_10]
MNIQGEKDLQAAKVELQAAETELRELNDQIQAFEALVDKRLGSLLDQLSQLNADTSALDEQLRRIREERLYGTDLLEYLDGAPRPTRPIDQTSLPPLGIPPRGGAQISGSSSPSVTVPHVPDIKVLYRQLARRYHPDLARNDADRVISNDQMKEINQAYAAGDLHTLMRLAGMSIPFSVGNQPSQLHPAEINKEPLSDLEQVNRKLKTIRQQIRHLSSLPIVKLSLDVKLARYARRDLLGEMVGELQYKLARKMAERDYLKAQIRANEGHLEQ